ncbi:exosome complex component RRP43 [Dioscorea cayenensis subsp. rotundata]|uniref:Ribosomal RNA-processing protein 43 n=1 Tax=Dioscorea cayennensis subsp. rotundata TaxID=55577 RepID=A0AB40BSG8_DIOCR|nr:exosome complex component RRP43 [Dioscorea cayenensis subsp. rotundata]
MASNSSLEIDGDMEVEAFRRLFPLRYYEHYLGQSVRPDARPLAHARETTIALGPVTSVDGSALVKIGETTMLAAIKLEVMTPAADLPDKGCLAVDFYMPPVCTPTVRPGRPAEAAPVISKQLSDVILSSGMINFEELSLISGKAAWMAYLDIYCLNADGSLFDAALLSAVAAFSHLKVPLVSVNDNGRVTTVTGELLESKSELELVNKERRKLSFKSLPFSLTCLLHGKYILADPTAEEEDIMDTLVTVVVDSLGRLVSLYKAGGVVLANTSTVKDCIALAKQRAAELHNILVESISEMEVD